jgi:hypothetical protein
MPAPTKSAPLPLANLRVSSPGIIARSPHRYACGVATPAMLRVEADPGGSANLPPIFAADLRQNNYSNLKNPHDRAARPVTVATLVNQTGANDYPSKKEVHFLRRPIIGLIANSRLAASVVDSVMFPLAYSVEKIPLKTILSRPAVNLMRYENGGCDDGALQIKRLARIETWKCNYFLYKKSLT